MRSLEHRSSMHAKAAKDAKRFDFATYTNPLRSLRSLRFESLTSLLTHRAPVGSCLLRAAVIALLLAAAAAVEPPRQLRPSSPTPARATRPSASTYLLFLDPQDYHYFVSSRG